ncbi:hypothetical protein [Clostridium butyricum]|uniref:hypothetical protein n=1 Tax=Clostridium butyricum TaxID=1492 RepID=UPI0022E2C4A8|nr:hypothetical protein [Clostridium butyricum]
MIEKELLYYAKDSALKPIDKDYVFARLLNPIHTKKGDQIQISVSVKYLYQ